MIASICLACEPAWQGRWTYFPKINAYMRIDSVCID
jgi:hypothetical protein